MFLREKIIRNVFYSWGYYTISILVGIFLMPFMVHRLGDTTYGIWVLVLSIAGYMGLFDLGIRGSIVKYVAELHAKNEQDKLNELTSTSFFTYSFIGFLVVCVTLIATVFLNNFFHIDQSLIYEAKVVLLLIGLNIAISLPLAVFGGVIWGLQRHDIFSIIEIIVLLIRTFLIVIFVYFGHKLIALAVITLLTNLLGNIIRIRFAWKINPGLRINYKLLKRSSMKLIFSYGFLVFLIGISARIISYTDSVVIGIFVSTAAITYYSIGLRFVDYSRDFISVMTSVLVPTASSFDSKNEFQKIKQLLILGTKYSLMLTLPIAITFILLGKQLISLWMGQKYVSSATILIILIIPQMAAIAQHIATAILLGIGKLKVLTILTICEAFANLLLSIILVKTYGLIGVALGTAIPFIIIKACILPIYICNIVKQNLIEYIRKTVILPFFASIPFILLMLIFKKIIYPRSIFAFIIEVLFCFTVYCLISIKLCIDKTERHALWLPIKKMLFNPVHAD